MDKMESDL